MGINFSLCDAFLLEMGFKDCQISMCNFVALELKNTSFVECLVKETDFLDTDLREADFNKSDLSGSLFNNTNLAGANFSNAKNYNIDPTTNTIEKARFSMPEAIHLLESFNIEIE